MSNKISRRKFLGQAGCAALGSATYLTSLANMELINALSRSNSSNAGDYKALVCVLLAGGCDSYNMVVPRGDNEYNEYAITRSTLALNQQNLLPITPLTSDGKSYGLHPSMGTCQNLFDQGKLAILSNVGTLVEPVVNNTELYNKTLPLGLFSHSDQIQQWQTSVPQSREAIGWGGRMADMLKSMNTNQSISMNVSLSGRNVFQSGNTVMDFSINNYGNGVESIQQYAPWYSQSGILHELRADAIESMNTQVHQNLLKETYGSLSKQSFDTIDSFSQALSNIGPFSTAFSDEGLSNDLAMVAKTIAARQELGFSRQTFFVTMGGWDHHDEVLNNQQYMLGVVSNAISEFFAALEEVETGFSDKVTLFTVSDFARTLTSNGNGSDHAWGGHALIAGGAVNGQEMYGTYPSLDLGSNLMTDDRGRTIPTTSADEYFAELALWFGVQPSELGMILPNIGNFYSASSNQMPIGFMPSVF